MVVAADGSCSLTGVISPEAGVMRNGVSASGYGRWEQSSVKSPRAFISNRSNWPRVFSRLSVSAALTSALEAVIDKSI